MKKPICITPFVLKNARFAEQRVFAFTRGSYVRGERTTRTTLQYGLGPVSFLHFGGDE